MPSANIPAYSLTRAQKGPGPSRYIDETPMPPAATALFFYYVDVLTFSGTLAAGATEERVFDAPGIEAGDIIAVTPEIDPGTACQWSAWVSDDDEITVRLVNTGATTATLTPRTWRAVVTRLA